MATLKLLYHEHQVYPLNPGGVYQGNETSIAFKDSQKIQVAPYELKAVGTNLDELFDHTFYVGLGITETASKVKDSLSSSYPDYTDLIGTELQEV